MKRITFHSLAGLTLVAALVAAGFAPQAIAATPNPNSAFVKERIFNDCPSSVTTLTVVNNYPALLSIEDANLACLAGANLTNWSFSEDGATQALFPNNSDFRYATDLVISGSGNGESGIRISPWWSGDVDGRFNVRVPDGEIACFGGRLPFYSFTANHGLHYAKGDPIRLEVIYKANGLSAASPATIEYRVNYLGSSYSSGALAFDQANPGEDPPHGLWGMLNEGRVGGYLQSFMAGDITQKVKATYSDIEFVICPIIPDPVAAIVKERIFNDCPDAVTDLEVVNSYPALLSIEDKNLACLAGANLTNWTFGDGSAATSLANGNDFSFSADLVISGTGNGESGLRLSPWWSKDVDGRFNVRVPDGEIACFGGRLPFYSFTGNHGLHYAKGNPIRLEVVYHANGLSLASPGTIEYKVDYLGSSYSSGPLNFDQANPGEDPPHGLWGILNDANAGGYLQSFMAGDGTQAVKATYTNIQFHFGVHMAVDVTPDALNLQSQGKWVTAALTPPAPYLAGDIDVSSLRLNGKVGPTGQASVEGNTLIVKFNRVAAMAALGQAGVATVTGDVAGECFRGSDVVRVLPVHAPTAGSSHAAGSTIEVRWTTPAEATVSSASIYASSDNGENWSLVAGNLPNTGRHAWTVAGPPSHAARMAVVLDDGAEGILGISNAFHIESTVGVGDPTALEFALRGMTPNPSKNGVHVAFSLPDARKATLSLYDVSGRRVAFREVGGMGSGRHTVTLARQLPAGMYVVRLSQGGRSLSTRAAVVR